MGSMIVCSSGINSSLPAFSNIFYVFIFFSPHFLLEFLPACHCREREDTHFSSHIPMLLRIGVPGAWDHISLFNVNARAATYRRRRQRRRAPLCRAAGLPSCSSSSSLAATAATIFAFLFPPLELPLASVFVTMLKKKRLLFARIVEK